MRRTDTDTDTLIRETLEAEDRAFLDTLDEPSMAELVTASFRSRRAFLNGITWIATLVFALVAVWSGWRLWLAEGTRELVLWFAVFYFSTMAVALNKSYYFLELHKVSLLREIKRLELQVAQLARGARDAEAEERRPIPRA